ncbi:MAG: hypothetical protein GX786_09115 [Clostridiales bacterium]|nr:hypothetical protein [Clostridiales bacterium]
MIRNVDPTLQSERKLRIYSNRGEISPSFLSSYPEVAILTDEEPFYYETWKDLAQGILSGTETRDILVGSTNIIDFATIMEKEYAYPLNDSAFIQDHLSSMYPYLQEGLTLKGNIYAIPLDVRASVEYGYNQKNFETLGIQNVPTTLMDFLDLYQWWLSEGQLQYPDYYFASYPLDKISLIDLVFNMYVRYYQDIQEPLHFDTPLFRDLISKILSLDAHISNLHELTDDQALEIMGNENVLIYSGYRRDALSPTSGNTPTSSTPNALPLMLSLEEGKNPSLYVVANIVYINPRGENKELAIAYLESLLMDSSNKEKVSFYPDYDMPIPLSQVDSNSTALQEKLAAYRQELQNAQPQDKAPLEEEILFLTRQLEETEIQWDVSPSSLILYQKLLPFLSLSPTVPSSSPGLEGDVNFYLLAMQLLEGSISLDQYIDQINQRARIIIGERE